MKKEHESTEHELRLYAVKEHEIRKQLIPPLLFFVAVGGISRKLMPAGRK